MIKIPGTWYILYIFLSPDMSSGHLMQFVANWNNFWPADIIFGFWNASGRLEMDSSQLIWFLSTWFFSGHLIRFLNSWCDLGSLDIVSNHSTCFLETLSVFWLPDMVFGSIIWFLISLNWFLTSDLVTGDLINFLVT